MTSLAKTEKYFSKLSFNLPQLPPPLLCSPSDLETHNLNLKVKGLGSEVRIGVRVGIRVGVNVGDQGSGSSSGSGLELGTRLEVGVRV